METINKKEIDLKNKSDKEIYEIYSKYFNDVNTLFSLLEKYHDKDKTLEIYEKIKKIEMSTKKG